MENLQKSLFVLILDYNERTKAEHNGGIRSGRGTLPGQLAPLRPSPSKAMVSVDDNGVESVFGKTGVAEIGNVSMLTDQVGVVRGVDRTEPHASALPLPAGSAVTLPLKPNAPRERPPPLFLVRRRALIVGFSSSKNTRVSIDSSVLDGAVPLDMSNHNFSICNTISRRL